MIRTSKRQRVEKRHFGEGNEGEMDDEDDGASGTGATVVTVTAATMGSPLVRKKKIAGGKTGSKLGQEEEDEDDTPLPEGIRTPVTNKSQKRRKPGVGRSTGGKVGRRLAPSEGDDEGEMPESPQQGLEFLIAAVSDVLVSAGAGG